MNRIRKILRKNRLKKANSYIAPDEIFLDSENIQNFDVQQFEGRIEKPVKKNTITYLGVFFILCGLAFIFRLSYLEVSKGEAYFKRSENNTLEKHILFADRGIIYDRNKVELATNKKDGETDFAKRIYPAQGFSHLLGYVTYPAADKSGHYWQQNFIGKDGLEKEYDQRLQGQNGTQIIETDVHQRVYSQNIVDAPVRGEDLTLTVDSRIQGELFQLIKDLAIKIPFQGGAGLLMDVRTGEIITSVSYPEYSSSILSQGKDATIIKGYFSDKRKVFMDRTLSGLYAPGSIVKPYVAMGALAENIIDPLKKILSTGSISIPNPFFPDQKSIFKDWRAQGWIDMRDALAVSSDVYFYEVGGGYQGQKGLGISNIEKYVKMFDIGQKTGVDMPDEIAGVIPSPEWKAKNFPSDPIWRLGDTYHTAIGQYGFQVTPIQIVRAVSAIANGGTLLTPHFLLADKNMEAKISTVDLNKNYFQIVREGMRQGVTTGISGMLNVPYVQVADKTGTAQIGVKLDKVNSWVTGFFPYQNPHYAFTILMEAGPASNVVGAVLVMRELLDWMSTNTPEYFQ